MAIGNVELMHGCFPKCLHIGTARMKDKDTEEEGKKSEYEKEYSGHEKKSSNGLNYSSSNTVPQELLCHKAMDELPS